MQFMAVFIGSGYYLTCDDANELSSGPASIYAGFTVSRQQYCHIVGPFLLQVSQPV